MPSKSETVPEDVPFTIILAPAKGWPLSSVTLPVTVDCANDIVHKKRKKSLVIVFILGDLKKFKQFIINILCMYSLKFISFYIIKIVKKRHIITYDII